MYERPATLSDALDLLQSGPWSVLAGGTDFYPMLGENKPNRPVLDITAIAELNRLEKDGWTWTEDGRHTKEQKTTPHELPTE